MSTRPNLSFLTQGVVRVEYCIPNIDAQTLAEDMSFEQAILSIPKLIQLAEMLFDMTAHEPDSLVHQMASKTLNDIAK